MQYILSWLPFLACPIGMGGMIWLMMRMGREQKPPEAAPKQEFEQVTIPQEESARFPEPALSQPPSLLKTIWECVQMCLNWKVLVGIAVIAVLIGIAEPSLFLASIPVLLVLVCPISMVVMMLRMGKMRQMASGGEASCPACLPESAEQPQVLEQPAEQLLTASPGRR